MTAYGLEMLEKLAGLGCLEWKIFQREGFQSEGFLGEVRIKLRSEYYANLGDDGTNRNVGHLRDWFGSNHGAVAILLYGVRLRTVLETWSWTTERKQT